MNFWYKIEWHGIVGETRDGTELDSRINEIISWGGKREEIKIEVIPSRA